MIILHFHQQSQFKYELFHMLYIKPKISNSNWTEWSTIQGVIARVISKSDEREARRRFEIMSTITPLIKTITKLSNVIGYQQSDLSINWTVAHAMLVIGQYASFFARFCCALC